MSIDRFPGPGFELGEPSANPGPGLRGDLESLLEALRGMLPVLATVLVVILCLAGARYFLTRRFKDKVDTGFGQELTMFLLTLLGIVVVLLALPVSEAMRSQLLSLFGLLLSAAIALSSTTFLGNMMAGFMLRAVRSFKTGDYLRCGDDFGRVTERGLLHTEIQTKDSDLTTLPNLHLVTTPYSVIRASGTIVTASVSLGYDVSRRDIESHLLLAANDVGLDQAFVHVTELGDFSVIYRVGGMLRAVKHLLSTRSQLRGRIMDRLHEGGIEIASPTLMSTRAYQKTESFTPLPEEHGDSERAWDGASKGEASSIEELAFEKADQAASYEELIERVAKTKVEFAEAQAARKKAKKAGDKIVRAHAVQDLEQRLARQEVLLSQRQKELAERDEGGE